MAILILLFGINVNASSNTSYSSWSPYIHWRTSENDSSFDSLSQMNDTVLYNRYLNIPLRIANYCSVFPGSSNGECPDSFKSTIGMVGISNASSSGVTNLNYNAFPMKYYSSSIDWVALEFRNGSNSKYTYTSSGSGGVVSHGYFNTNNDANDYDQTHKQPIYYVNDTHSSYPFRTQFRTRLSLNNPPNTTSDNTQPAFSAGNIIMYKMSYMLGPTNGSFGDGTWSSTSPEYDPSACDDCYSLTYEQPYLDVKRNARMWLEDESNYNNYDYNNKSWYLQNNHFGNMFDSLTYTSNSNVPGCADGELCANTSLFQGSNPMNAFLNLYGHTYYDKSTGNAYNKRTTLSNGLSGTNTIQWYSSGVYGKITLQNSGDNVTSLSTSTIIVAQPYNWVYDDNGTTYYSTVWMLDFYFFGYIDSTYEFNQIKFEYFLDNQLSTYGSVRQIDFMKPENQVAVIGRYNVGDELSSSLDVGIGDSISQIPVIGPIIAIIYDTLKFCFNFIFSFVNLLSDLPGWFKGAFIVLFISIVCKIVHKIIRGG